MDANSGHCGRVKSTAPVFIDQLCVTAYLWGLGQGKLHLNELLRKEENDDG